MIPHTQQALGFVIQRLLTSIGPELTTSYAMADLGLIATLLSMFGQDFTRAADARQTDIQEMADIFSDAQGLIRDAEFRKKLAATQGLHLTNFDIDNLDACISFAPVVSVTNEYFGICSSISDLLHKPNSRSVTTPVRCATSFPEMKRCVVNRSS